MMPEQTWWERIPACIGLQKKIMEALAVGKSVMLDPAPVAWPEELRHRIHAKVIQHDHAMPWDHCDVSGCPADVSPLMYLFESLGEEDPYATPMRCMQRLRKKNACLWISGIPQQQRAAWRNMAMELTQEGCKLRLILELPNAPLPPDCTRCVQLDTTCSRFDIYYFALMLLSASEVHERQMDYAALLCTELSGLSPEVCSMLAGRVMDVMQDPEGFCAQHLPEKNVRRAVCRAQLRALMAQVEMGRVLAIDILRDQLQGIIPFTADFNMVLEDVESFELRHIVYAAREKRIITVEEPLSGLLKKLRDARNEIAHMHMLDYESICNLGKWMMHLESIHGAACAEE